MRQSFKQMLLKLWTHTNTQITSHGIQFTSSTTLQMIYISLSNAVDTSSMWLMSTSDIYGCAI